jgi:glycine/D-amino acid oxidase-like deaminating enzyme
MLYDFCVVGGGIAGLAVAELLARSGRSVALLERDSKLTGEASATQHSWFHTGALYAALPTNAFFRTLVGNVDDLLDYYACFPNMNLRVERNIHTTSTGGWFSNYTIFYAYVSPRSKEVRPALKLPWWIATRRAERRLAWFENLDFRRVLSDQVQRVERKVSVGLVKRKGALGVELGDLAVVLKSKDRTMNTRLIARDLAASFLGSGGELFLNTPAREIHRQEVIVDRGSVRARHIVVAAGSEAGRLAQVRTRLVFSPLLVVYPALAAINFVRMTPRLDQTLNHLYHRVDGVEYSVVGSALYHDVDSEENRQAALETMRSRMLEVFPESGNRVWSVYFGPKAELVNASQLRNYQYHITDGEHCTVVLPGKFTLAFSLAVNTCRHFGVEPLQRVAVPAPDGAPLDSIIAEPRHYLAALEAKQRNEFAAAENADEHLQPVRW